MAGIILSALAAAGNEGIKSIDRNLDEDAKIAAEQRANASAVQRSDLELQKQKALMDYRTQTEQAPATKAGAYLRDALAEDVPVTAPKIIDMKGIHPTETKPDGSPIYLLAGNYEKWKEKFNTIPNERERVEALAGLEEQYNLEQKAADDAVAGQVRKRNQDEAMIAAREKALAAGDLTSYQALKNATKGTRTHVGAGGVIFNEDTEKVVYQNDTAERIAQKKIDAASELEDKKIAGRERALEMKYDANAKKADFSQADIDGAAHDMGSYRMKPLGERTRNTPFGRAVMARVRELYPAYDEKKYGAMSSAVKSFSTGKEGALVRSLNVAIDHIATGEGLVDAISSGDAKQINRLSNLFSKQTGATAVTNFEAAKHIIADEVVKSVVGGAAALADREQMANSINAANSPAQLKEALLVFKALMRGQLDGLKDQYERATGESDFEENFMSKAALEALHGAGHGPGRTATAVGDTTNPAQQKSAPTQKTTTVPNPVAAPSAVALPSGLTYVGSRPAGK